MFNILTSVTVKMRDIFQQMQNSDSRSSDVRLITTTKPDTIPQ